ncbi:hypothetical protein T11_8222 [Trichinella zimbabwensis]|uniref:Uncharacterized protein n=1 Tax=Trichinella zimbabwensis TaxID=268475 RepID=A0A0V1HCQ4_9BILA|nr:hypothetical protein T11_8222 [Trichinella zimbabwensis]
MVLRENYDDTYNSKLQSRTWRTSIDQTMRRRKFFTGMKHLKLNSDCITQDSVEQFTRHKITRVCENLCQAFSKKFKTFIVEYHIIMCFYLKIEIQ